MHFRIGGINALISRLLKAYRRIGETKLCGLPIFNNNLEVEAVGFEYWEDRPLGVIIAPWFMNLTLLPNKQDNWLDLDIGSKQPWKLPSGHYEFLVSPVEEGNVVQSLSLFTTVTEFPDQQFARDIAQDIMDKVLLKDRKVITMKSVSAEANCPRMLKKPISRREILRSLLWRGD